MRSRALLGRRLAGLACLSCLAAAGAVRAGGPLLIGRDGTPRRWRTSSPVTVNLDRGPLGGIADPAELMEYAAAQWNGVETAALRVAIGERLSSDVEGLSESQFNSFITKDDGTNPVIFDSSGAIFRNIYGAESGVIGVAGPSLIQSGEGTIVKGFAMFNGEGATDASIELLRAAMTHELGHMLNLEHTQINGLRVGSPVPGFQGLAGMDDVETMFPVLVQSNATPHPMATLHRDDIAAFSALYPSADFAATTATITGLVLDVDGATHLQGVNVIARNVNRPFEDAVSYVSGLLFDASSSSAAPALRGAFELRGLTPNETYRVYIEEVASFFKDGARVGPLDPPLDLDSTQAAAFLELWNGANESAADPPDDPLDAVNLRITAGGTASRVDFIFNGVRPRVEAIEPEAGSYLRLTSVTVTGANFTGSLSVFLRGGGRTVTLPGVLVVDAGTLTAKVPSGVVPGVYKVVVASSRGESEESPVEFTVTEPEPSVTALSPDALENDRPREVSILGTHLLGTRAVLLRRAGVPDVPVNLESVVTASRVLAEVPAGVVPGAYSVVVTNTAGESPPSPGPLFILELAPLLAGETDPPSARNSKARSVRIEGSNLAGTTAVELVRGGSSVAVPIVSTSLDAVVVTVPKGLEPGTYTVRVTNTEASVTGPTVFVVKKAGGGGGGCAESACPDSASPADLTAWALLVALALRRRHSRGRHGTPYPPKKR